MLFNSLSFLVFLPVVFLSYWLIPNRFRRIFLLLASCYFYMALVPKYIIVLFFLITADYFLAFLIDRGDTAKKRKAYLILSIGINIGTLLFFKYFNFFSENAALLGKLLHFNYDPVLLKIILPVGLSFHVFQSLCYVIEVYKKRYKPETSYITYALYVLFFPQLVAGPIERPQHLLPQLNTEHRFDAQLARRGLERILWGFFKKLVIADQLARVISSMFVNLPTDSMTIALVMAMFTYQLYCDFSGYSDIAIGCAMLLGFRLTENFNRPFAARSIGEFWRRWHISLSGWLRDYLYYPLVFRGRDKDKGVSGGTQSQTRGKGITKFRLHMSTLITFALIGLWHGANWTYVIFGAIHGVYLVMGSVTEKLRTWLTTKIGLSRLPRMHRAIQALIVFCLVTFSLVFFRAESLAQSWWLTKYLFSSFDPGFLLSQIRFNSGYSVLGSTFLPALAAIIVMEIVQYYQAKKNTLYIFEGKPKFVRYGWYYAVIASIMMLGYFGGQSFIYFKF